MDINSKTRTKSDLFYYVSSQFSEFSISLNEVFDCDEWRNLINEIPKPLFLSVSSYSDFPLIPNSMVLSYRWKEERNILCKVRAPLEETESPPRQIDISMEAIEILKRTNFENIWIDFLSHLNDSSHKFSVMSQMGIHYLNCVVYPNYLSDDVNSTKTIEKESSFAESLRRGWIQQEISYGSLNREVISNFVYYCLTSSDYSSLLRLLRRRATALNWFNQCVQYDTSYNKSNEKYELALYSSYFKLSPTFIPNNPDEALSYLSTYLGELKRDHATWNNFQEKLIYEICKKQIFQSHDVFCAYQLIRSFAESSLKYEQDAYVAMLECAAYESGYGWDVSTPCSNETYVVDRNLQILYDCWKTLLHKANDTKISFSFRVERQLPLARSMGLRNIESYLSKQVQIIISEYPNSRILFFRKKLIISHFHLVVDHEEFLHITIPYFVDLVDPNYQVLS